MQCTNQITAFALVYYSRILLKPDRNMVYDSYFLIKDGED